MARCTSQPFDFYFEKGLEKYEKFPFLFPIQPEQNFNKMLALMSVRNTGLGSYLCVSFASLRRDTVDKRGN